MNRGQVAAAILVVSACGLLRAGEPGLRKTLVHPDEAPGIAFFPDGKSIASACCDKALRVWDVSTGKVVQTFRHDDELWSVAVASVINDPERLTVPA